MPKTTFEIYNEEIRSSNSINIHIRKWFSQEEIEKANKSGYDAGYKMGYEFGKKEGLVRR